MNNKILGLHGRYEWRDGENEVPIHDGLVLGVVSGTNGRVTLEDAYELICYVPGEGWISEAWPEMRITVKWWMELPEVPKGGRKCLKENIK